MRVLLILILIVGCSKTSEEYNFRKARWGMSKKEVKESEYRVLDWEAKRALGYKDTLHSFPCDFKYGFDSNGLSYAYYSLKQEHKNKFQYLKDFREINELLKDEYGKAFEEEKVWKKEVIDRYNINTLKGKDIDSLEEKKIDSLQKKDKVVMYALVEGLLSYKKKYKTKETIIEAEIFRGNTSIIYSPNDLGKTTDPKKKPLETEEKL